MREAPCWQAPCWYTGKPGEAPATGDAPGIRSGAAPVGAHGWLAAGDGSWWWAAGAAWRAAWPAFLGLGLGLGLGIGSGLGLGMGSGLGLG